VSQATLPELAYELKAAQPEMNKLYACFGRLNGFGSWVPTRYDEAGIRNKVIYEHANHSD
jgi:hypothetical protein